MPKMAPILRSVILVISTIKQIMFIIMKNTMASILFHDPHGHPKKLWKGSETKALLKAVSRQFVNFRHVVRLLVASVKHPYSHESPHLPPPPSDLLPQTIILTVLK